MFDVYESRERRIDFRTGLIVSSVYNTAQNKRVFTPGDFFPHLKDGEEREQEPEVTLAAIQQWAAITGLPLEQADPSLFEDGAA